MTGEAMQYFVEYCGTELGLEPAVADRLYRRDAGKVADAAIDAAQHKRLDVAYELQKHAQHVLSQTEPNPNPQGWKWQKVIRMNHMIEAFAKQSI